MSNKTKVIVAVVALLSAYAFGRFSAPTKEKIVTQTVEVEKKVDTTKTDAERNRRRDTTTTKEIRPDGTVTEVTHTIETAQTDTKTNQSDSDVVAETKTQDKEITRDSSKVTISALAGVRFSTSDLSPVLYGASISKPVLGPITVSVWGLSDLSFGAGIGLTF